MHFDYGQSGNKELHLSVCDLAGSERADRSGNLGAKLKEASSINKSLMILNKCIFALVKKERVPYRESKLTKLLCEYFKDSSNNLIMIANINPHEMDFDETLRVLNFTSMAKKSQPIKSTIDQSWKFSSSNKIRVIRKSNSMQVINNVQSQQQVTVQQLQQQKQELETAFQIYKINQNLKQWKIKMQNQLQQQKQQDSQNIPYTNIFRKYLDSFKESNDIHNGNTLCFSDSLMKQIEKFSSCENSNQFDQMVNKYLNKPNLKICNKIVNLNFNMTSKVNQGCSPMKQENNSAAINPINKNLYNNNQRSACKKMFDSVKKQGQSATSKDKKCLCGEIKYKKHKCSYKYFQI